MAPDTSSRVLRSTNPKISHYFTAKSDKPVSSRGSSQDPDEDVEDVKETASPVDEAKLTTSTKRKRDTAVVDSKKSASTAKKARTIKTASASAATSKALVNNLKDSVRPGLILISIGVNPGKLTGQIGHPYSHKSNHYWPGLHKSGITPIQHKPSEAHSLMDLYGLGHTNIVPEIATASESGLTAKDFLDGAAVLDTKIRSLRPEAVMLLGRGIWYRWMQYKTGKRYDPKKEGPLDMGLQDEKFWVGREVVRGEVIYEGARTFVLESPSGQAAISSEQRIKNWKVVGDWFAPRREKWMEEKKEEQAGATKEEDGEEEE